jgi:hypothetical protein
MKSKEEGRTAWLWPKAARDELQRAYAEAEQAAATLKAPSFNAEPLDGGCLLYRPFPASA